ncbi:transcription-repair coupling factor [Convivina intestini]|uniref:transcription-repair coupling factor n=1 Tax=Convivina intestini TaxID=1505726 RepID=UPI00200C6899|nr:transcription-repair coupling factor [Convivina intestini]CAH1855634.1 Transcription-repair-coupling factor [Convivina intestini]
MTLTNFLKNNSTIQKIQEQLKPKSKQLLLGINGTAKAASLAALYAANPQQMVIVTDTQAHLDSLYQDLSQLVDEQVLYTFPAEESLATDLAVHSADFNLQRVAALTALLSGQPLILVTNLAGFSRLLPNPDQLKKATLNLSVGQSYDFNQLKNDLLEMGYQATQLVENPGEFAQRGAIFDIYSPFLEQPIRLDFFDDELDQIKQFDPMNQKSMAKLKQVVIQPASDLIIDVDQYETGKQAVETAFRDYRSQLTGVEKKHATDGFSTTQVALNEQSRQSFIQPYLSFFYPQATTVLDYLADNALVVLDEWTRLEEFGLNQLQRDQEWLAQQVKSYQLLPSVTLPMPLTKILAGQHRPELYLANFQRGLNRIHFTNIAEVTTRPATQYFGQLPALKNDLLYAQEKGLTVVMLISNASRIEHFQQSLADFETPIPVSREIQANQVQIMLGSLSTGFEWVQDHLVVLTERELFTHARQPVRRVQKTMANAERLKSYNELEVGDYVVHINHGIGQYQGLQTLDVDGGKQDYLEIAYQKNAKIFVPVNQLNLIQKYIGASDAAKAPRLNKLGGSEWHKTKRQVAAKIEDIADDLLNLYAQREAQSGYAFPPDDVAQLKFDTSFGYPETPDQIRSIEEIKVDMQKIQPMDRLLVGDVGFGKTEVALRAVFKAAHAGKQVAFLAPTTILVQQHYETLLARFADFPEIKIGTLSRFQTNAQNRQTIKELEDHQLDVVVGTHRLLSKDVTFVDLGLLIIDEEQRFGVKHKERLKALKTNVDVLTLTATPIPRTLNMAMVGARDLSVIETPPANRFPIQTYVLEFDWAVVRAAIEKELARDGQVFYLHNRVSDLDRIAAQIEEMVPDSRVAVIHGQMSETQLEGVLYDFLNRQYDVLVTTTIIETGVDIPNANTLIVDNADHMGLSQLYQLRGRVGRSARLAYAYFTYPFSRTPSPEAEKRLEAIRDFTELGSGFRIAMRDLSIRGAGDLLGKQQHGFIDSVGYDMYTQMLKDTVAKKQGKVVDAPVVKSDAELILGVLAYLPEDYIPDNAQKIDLYTQIRLAVTDEDFEQVEENLIDRFGELPDPVARLLLVGRIKSAADQAQVTQIRRQKKELSIQFNAKATKQLAGVKIFEALKDVPLKAVVGAPDQQLKVTLTIDDRQESSIWLNILRNFLLVIIEMQQQEMEK